MVALARVGRGVLGESRIRYVDRDKDAARGDGRAVGRGNDADRGRCRSPSSDQEEAGQNAGEAQDEPRAQAGPRAMPRHSPRAAVPREDWMCSRQGVPAVPSR